VEQESIEKMAAEESRLNAERSKLEQANTQILGETAKLRGEIVMSSDSDSQSVRRSVTGILRSLVACCLASKISHVRLTRGKTKRNAILLIDSV
jgi:hypothetical protein